VTANVRSPNNALHIRTGLINSRYTALVRRPWRTYKCPLSSSGHSGDTGAGSPLRHFSRLRFPTVSFAESVIRNAPSKSIPPEEEPETCCNVDGRTVLTLGVTSTLKLTKPFRTIAIGDPKVVDVLPDTDQMVTLHPLAYGETNIVFFDESQHPIYTVGVVVSDPARLGQTVTVHNRNTFAGFLTYRCGNGGCEYLEAGARWGTLPKGYSNQTITTTNTNINTGP